MLNQQFGEATLGAARTSNSEAIQHFFSCLSANGANETLWDMFSESISNPEAPTDHAENAKRSFLYKRLTELIMALEPQD